MKRFLIVSLLMSLLLFSGCSGLNTEELYCLPEAPETYYDLQEVLSQELSAGLAYHAPASGTRREPVQLVDLNSDGVDEAVAFFRSTTDGAVKTYIFSNQDGIYEMAAVIDCAGSAVASIEYADLTGSGDLELLISCQVSETVTQALQVCRYVEGEAVTLATIPCSRYKLPDLDTDGARELMCFIDNGSEACSLSFHRFREEQLVLEKELKLSTDYSSILDMVDLTLSDEAKALAVTSSYGQNQTAYDVLTLVDGELKLLQPKEELLISDNLRGGVLYPQDMDGDGNPELPRVQGLPAYGEGTAAQSVVLWHGLDTEGDTELRAVTYHDFNCKWYLELPDAWQTEILVKQNDTATPVSTVSSATFYHLNEQGKAGEELLTIYTLKGSTKQTFAEQQGLNILYSDTEVIYAAKLPEGAESWIGAMTMTQVSDGFHIIKE